MKAITLLILLATLAVGEFNILSETSLRSNFSELKGEVLKIAADRNIPSLHVIINAPSDSLIIDYHNPDVKDQEIYGIGSSTKLMASALIFNAVEKGLISLTDSVQKYIDEKLAPDIKGFDGITIGHLLNHTSGLSDYTNHPTWFSTVLENKAPSSFEERVALIDTQLSNKGFFRYSNTNYLFLEKIVATAFDTDHKDVFNQFYSEHGLDDIQFINDRGELQSYFATDEKSSSDVSALKEHYGFDGGAYSTPASLKNFMQKMFVDSDILTETSLSSMQQWIQMSPMDIPIGDGQISEYGYGLMRLDYKGELYIGHMGGTLKYQSFLFYHAESNTTLTAVTNCSGRFYNNAFFQELIPAILDRLPDAI